jgi:dihydroneopterin aldolase
MYLYRVALVDAEFYAYHGYYAQENVLGGQYLVNIELIKSNYTVSLPLELSHTLDYQTLYKIADTHMQKRYHLLEEIAHNIITDIKTEFHDFESVTVSIAKKNPPIGGLCKQTEVSLTYINK